MTLQMLEKSSVHARSLARLQVLPAVVRRERAERGFGSGEDRPVRAVRPLSMSEVSCNWKRPANPQIPHHAGDDGTQVEVVVGDMDRQDAIRVETGEIESPRLPASADGSGSNPS